MSLDYKILKYTYYEEITTYTRKPAQIYYTNTKDIQTFNLVLNEYFNRGKFILPFKHYKVSDLVEKSPPFQHAE